MKAKEGKNSHDYDDQTDKINDTVHPRLLCQEEVRSRNVHCRQKFRCGGSANPSRAARAAVCGRSPPARAERVGCSTYAKGPAEEPKPSQGCKHAAFLARDEDAARLLRIVAAVSLVDIGALDLAASPNLCGCFHAMPA